eukprot:TRINITY_DN72837_c0_g1_i1.p1 TRINITY_DN72837_c0_g1~~TRINITY_DN72837_c0_g1_i1.p1  ORF type:complete len:537 (-),score=81.58 TRINITY_DN72837_c0_g1_i1:242-1852(-)
MAATPPAGKGAPPPPKGKGKGPPPKGAGKGPPLPSGALQTDAAQEVPAGPRLRPLFWTSTSRVGSDTLWENLVPAVAFDQALLERHFALAESKAPTPSERRVVASASEPRKRLRVLDDRTSQKLAIAFNRLPPPERLAALVDSFEEFPEGMPSEAVLALNSAVSEQKEAIDQLRQLGSQGPDVSQLDMPERYLWVLCAEPSLAEKLACGALIVGPARELGELRYAGMAVGTCCRALRESKLLQKCISTCLAIGNIVNRGTARSGARALVLPDSLLKLEDLRGIASENDESPAGNNRGMSLLDFVAHALVEDARRIEPLAFDVHSELRGEVEDLWGKVRAAQSVSLDDSERQATHVCNQADKCYKSLTTMRLTSGVRRIAERIREIHDEAHTAKTLLMAGRMELSKTQKWSSAKANVKCDEWLCGWSSFLEQLAAAFGRVRVGSSNSTSNKALPFRAVKSQDGCPTPSPVSSPVVSKNVLATSGLFQPANKPIPSLPKDVTPSVSNKANVSSTDAVSKPASALFAPVAVSSNKENCR